MDNSDENVFLPSQKKSRSITFRLDSYVIDEIQRDANQNEVSLNVLINKILKLYVEWGRYEQKLGMMPIPQNFVSSLIQETIRLAENNGISIDPYKEKLIRYSADVAFSTIKESVILMRKKFDLWAVLSVLQEYMKVSGITSDHRIEEGKKHIFVIRHELGEYWSLFAKELLNLIFFNLANIRAEITITEKSIIAEVII
ncbi:MAG: hypothetical protein AB7F53_07820 [Nitrososphaeraceae archaeon]